MTTKKIRLIIDLEAAFGLHACQFRPIPPVEIDELYYIVDDITGDGRGVH